MAYTIHSRMGQTIFCDTAREAAELVWLLDYGEPRRTAALPAETVASEKSQSQPTTEPSENTGKQATSELTPSKGRVATLNALSVLEDSSEMDVRAFAKKVGLTDGRALGNLYRTITNNLPPDFSINQVVRTRRINGVKHWVAGKKLSEARAVMLAVASANGRAPTAKEELR